MTGFTNAGFETGDFTAWSTEALSGALLYVQSSTKSEGSYALAANLASDGSPVSQSFSCLQNIDFTDIDEITFGINITTFNGGGESCYLKVSIDAVDVATYTTTTSGFETATIDTSAISGIKEVKFYAMCPLPDW